MVSGSVEQLIPSDISPLQNGHTAMGGSPFRSVMDSMGDELESVMNSDR